jgi:hypothetical protein
MSLAKGASRVRNSIDKDNERPPEGWLLLVVVSWLDYLMNST